MISSSNSTRLCVHLARGDSIGVLVSGGLDSCVLTAQLLKQGLQVQPFHIQSDLCWHEEEWRAVNRFLDLIRSPDLCRLVTLEMPLADLYEDHWSVTRQNTPSAGTADDAVFLPGRNSLLAIKAALWCQLHKIGSLALAALRTNSFSDTSKSFITSFQSVINLPKMRPVHLLTPMAHMTKREVMLLGHNYPLHATFSCIAPVEGLHCGRCNKCAERRQAFRSAGLRDHSTYACVTATNTQ